MSTVFAVIKKGVFQPFLEKFRRYRLSAGDQGRARTVRDRFTRLPRILEFRREEGLFGHRDFLEARTAVRSQRLSLEFAKALLVRDELQRDSAEEGRS